jgi:hypothetical protein
MLTLKSGNAGHLRVIIGDDSANSESFTVTTLEEQ